MNFRGRSVRNLDPKGRLMLSPEYRESLALRMLTIQNTNIFTHTNITNLSQSEQSIYLTKEDSQNPLYQHSSQNQENQEQLLSNEAQQISQIAIKNTATLQETKLVITTYDNCLAAYPWQDWLKLEEQFARLVNPSSKVRAFRRLFIGGAEEQILDAQGRIRLSTDHKDYAQLEKEVTILGLITRFELWNPHLLKSHIAAQSLDDVTEELSASGIDFAL